MLYGSICLPARCSPAREGGLAICDDACGLRLRGRLGLAHTPCSRVRGVAPLVRRCWRGACFAACRGRGSLGMAMAGPDRLYAATVGVRIAALFGERANRSDGRHSVRLEDVMDAVVFRISARTARCSTLPPRRAGMLRLAPELLLGNGPVRTHPCGRPRRLSLRAVGHAWERCQSRTWKCGFACPARRRFAATDNYRTFTIELAKPL